MSRKLMILSLLMALVLTALAACSSGKGKPLEAGGIYEDRFLVKPVKSAVAMMPNADLELPYEGAKEMLLVDDVENRELLLRLDVDGDPGFEVDGIIIG